jgi:hypothetical protein
MSTTITIRYNREYCTENELVENVLETCNCADELDDQAKADPNCPYCYGKGTVSSRKFPFEFNLANGNFVSLWRSLGLTLREDVWGHIDGRTLLRVLEVPVEKLLTPDSQYDGDQGGTLIDFGISRSQAEYLSRRSRTASRFQESRKLKDPSCTLGILIVYANGFI